MNVLRLLSAVLLATSSAACVASSGAVGSDESVEGESTALSSDPRPALRTHTFHVARGILSPAGFSDQGGALVLRLPYAPMAPVFADLGKTIGNPKLKTRGEAHVTVLTPAEVAATHLPMSTLLAIAQGAAFVDDLELACLGVGMNDRKPSLQTFYLVARSKKLSVVRGAIAAKAHGSFDPNAYFPHVTVGFTSRDLFPESDGIHDKDVSTCPSPTGLKLDGVPPG